MSVLEFAEDFSRLIIRYTKTFSWNNEPSNSIVSLTEEQIVHTIHHVLQSLSIKGFENKNNNLLEIPTSTNAVISETSDVNTEPKDEIIHACRSEDSVFMDEYASASDNSLKTNKKDQENSFNTLENEKKFISRSNPAIYFNKITRSDTFVREDTKKVNDQNQKDIFKDFINSETNDLASDLLQESLNDIRKLTMDIMEKLNYLEQSCPQSIKLSKEEDKAKICSSFCKTPSPTLLVENRNIFERRKSTGGIRTNIPTKKSGESKMCLISNISNVNMSVSASSNSPKITKNPKYAHVQSTVSKIINQKKKM